MTVRSAYCEPNLTDLLSRRPLVVYHYSTVNDVKGNMNQALKRDIGAKV